MCLTFVPGPLDFFGIWRGLEDGGSWSGVASFHTLAGHPYSETPLPGLGPWPCCPGPSLEEDLGVPASFLPLLRHAGAAPGEVSQTLLEPLSPEIVYPTLSPLFRVAGTSVSPTQVTLTFPNRAPVIRISLRCWSATRSGGWICWTNT